MTVRVALFGAGVLGRRHLAALAGLGEPVVLTVIDPSAEAVAAARAAFAEAGFPQGSHLADGADATAADVAIVATNARERLDAIRRALSLAPALLVEKVLFTRLAEYDAAAAMLAARGATAFVNCVRRSYGSFAHLSPLVAGRAFAYRVEGAGWGLGCNLIHHLDEFAALAGTTAVTLDPSGLDPGVIPARRPGYVEFTGTMRGRTPGGATFEATCTAGPPGDRVVTITAADTTAEVSQTAATLTLRDAAGTRTQPIDIPLQSRITASHVRDMLAGRAPPLPDYATAAALHRPMIAAFLEHLRRSSGRMEIDECPIT